MCVVRHLMQSLGAVVSQTSSRANFASALIVLGKCHLGRVLKTFQNLILAVLLDIFGGPHL